MLRAHGVVQMLHEKDRYSKAASLHSAIFTNVTGWNSLCWLLRGVTGKWHLVLTPSIAVALSYCLRWCWAFDLRSFFLLVHHPPCLHPSSHNPVRDVPVKRCHRLAADFTQFHNLSPTSSVSSLSLVTAALVHLWASPSPSLIFSSHSLIPCSLACLELSFDYFMN